MAVPNRKPNHVTHAPRIDDASDIAVPTGNAPPHDLQRLLIARLDGASGLTFPTQPTYAPFAEQVVQGLSRLAGVALFGAALVSAVLLIF